MTARKLAIGGILLVCVGLVALYLGGIWADENQAGGNPALWLIPLAGLVLLITGVTTRNRQRGNSR